MAPSHIRRHGRLYRYLFRLGASRRGHDTCPVHSIAASEAEWLVLGQVRRLLAAPSWSRSKPRRHDTLIKALVRAHRWRRRIETGRAKSITDLAEQEGATDAYSGGDFLQAQPVCWAAER
jgi:hypothetical protein